MNASTRLAPVLTKAPYMSSIRDTAPFAGDRFVVDS